MPAVIDRAGVKSACAARLLDVLDGSGVAYVRTTDQPEDGENAWAQIVAVDLTLDDRPQSSGEADTATLTVTVNVATRDTNEHALEDALAIVANAFDEWTSDETDGQILQMNRAQAVPDSGPTEEGEVRTGMVQADGRVQRGSGLTMLSFLS